MIDRSFYHKSKLSGTDDSSKTDGPGDAQQEEVRGAARVVDRAEIAAPGRALEGETWAAAIDTVGGDTLAGIIRALAYNGAVAACGNAGGVQLNTTVFPFILRGTKLLGVESVLCPFNRRQVAWARLAQDLTPELLDSLVQVVSLANVPEVSRQIVAGQIRGRVVVDVNT